MTFNTQCARGCTVKGQHVDTCDESSPEGRLVQALFGARVKPCPGCLPRDAAEGTLLCHRCLAALRDKLTRAPDLAAHLRSVVDPLKAVTYDADKGTGSKPVHAPAPMDLGAIDAASAVISDLTSWSAYFGGHSAGTLADGFPSWIDAELAYDLARSSADYLLDDLTEHAKNPIIVNCWEAICGYPPADAPDSQDLWTIAKALARFPMNDQPKWAEAPCPNLRCSMRTVRVTPARFEGDHTRYLCQNCGWTPPAAERETWADYFDLVTGMSA